MRRLTALAAVLLTVTACTPSEGDGDADVVIRGTVVEADGSPRANAPVVLLGEADPGEAVPASACMVDDPPAVCARAHRATTGDDGGYSFQVPGASGATFHLSTAVPDGGPSVSARFQGRGSAVRVPTLRLWDPNVELSVAQTIRAEWSRFNSAGTQRLVFLAEPGGEVTWASDGRNSVALDARVLEDSRGTAAVEAGSNADGDGTTFRVTHRSRQVPFTGTAGPPPSRDAPCTPDPCLLTDGDLTPAGTGVPSRQEVDIDLGSSQAVSLVVVRGCPASCHVETSVDGRTFRIAGSAERPFFFVTPALTTPIRYVRVRSGVDISGLAEVSVW